MKSVAKDLNHENLKKRGKKYLPSIPVYNTMWVTYPLTASTFIIYTTVNRNVLFNFI